MRPIPGMSSNSVCAANANLLQLFERHRFHLGGGWIFASLLSLTPALGVQMKADTHSSVSPPSPQDVGRGFNHWRTRSRSLWGRGWASENGERSLKVTSRRRVRCMYKVSLRLWAGTAAVAWVTLQSQAGPFQNTVLKSTWQSSRSSLEGSEVPLSFPSCHGSLVRRRDNWQPNQYSQQRLPSPPNSLCYRTWAGKW